MSLFDKFGILICLLGLPVFGAHRPMKSGDPNREQADWDWQTRDYIELYCSPDAATVKKMTTYTPFYSYGSQVWDHREPDMHPEDGWVLVHRDFGIPEGGQAFPFFTLYNKYRGIFRIMLFNATNREGSFFVGELSFVDGSKYSEARTGLFTFADNKKSQCSLKEYDPEVKLTAISQMVANDSWAVFDYNLLGFDPGFGAKDPIILFKLSSIERQSIKLNTVGNLQLFQAITTSLPVRAGFTSTSGSAYQTASGLIEVGKKGYATYKTFDSFIQNEVLSQAAQEKHKDDSWYGAIRALASSKVAGTVPYVAAFGSVVECFVGGSSTASNWEPLNFTGQLELDASGALQTTRDLWYHCFYLKQGTPDGAKAHRPLRSVPWGLYNFREIPCIHTPTVIRATRHNLSSFDGTTKLYAEPELVFNPDSGMTLSSTRVAFILSDEMFSTHMRGERSRTVASPFMTIPAAKDTGYTYFHHTGHSPDQFHPSMVHPNTTVGFHPFALLWEFKFKVQQPTRLSDSEIVVYKRTGMRDLLEEASQARFKAWREAHPNAGTLRP